MAKSGEVKVAAMFLHMVFPTYDALSDIAYLTGTPFYNKIIFVFTALFMSFSLFMYIRDIYILNAYPCIFWLTYAIELPKESKRFYILLPVKDHGYLHWFVYELFVWVLAILMQVLYPVFLFVWLLFGGLLYISKMISVGAVW